MTHAFFNRILEQLEPMQLKKVCPYLENEPLNDPHIFERIKKIIDRLNFTSIEFSTNALALNRVNAEKLADLLYGINHEIWISFHGIDKHTHEGIMGISYSKCLQNIIFLLKLADEYPLRINLRGSGIGLLSDFHHDFEFSQEQYQKFWENQFEVHGIERHPRINFFRYHDRAGMVNGNDFQLCKIIRPDLTNFECSRVGDYLHFIYTGELIICCMDYHREEVFADIRSQNIDEILAGPYQKLIDKVEGRQPTRKSFICKRCIYPEGTGKKLRYAEK